MKKLTPCWYWSYFKAQMSWLAKYSSTAKTVEEALINSLSWVQLLACWPLCNPTFWLEEKARKLPISCSIRDAGWKTTTFHPWGHLRVVWKDCHVVYQEEHQLPPKHCLHHLAPEHTLHYALLLRLPAVISCSNLHIFMPAGKQS